MFVVFFSKQSLFFVLQPKEGDKRFADRKLRTTDELVAPSSQWKRVAVSLEREIKG